MWNRTTFIGIPELNDMLYKNWHMSLEIWDNISSIQGAVSEGTARRPKLHAVLSEFSHLRAHQSTQSMWKSFFVFLTHRSKQTFTLNPSSRRCTHRQLCLHSRCSTRKRLKHWTTLGFICIFFFSSEDLMPQLCEKATFCLEDQQMKAEGKTKRNASDEHGSKQEPNDRTGFYHWVCT